MNALISNKTRQELVAEGFNFAGTTTDETMLAEIKRDYHEGGYSDIEFIRERDHISYWTRHPIINPRPPMTAEEHNAFPKGRWS